MLRDSADAEKEGAGADHEEEEVEPGGIDRNKITIQMIFNNNHNKHQHLLPII